MKLAEIKTIHRTPINDQQLADIWLEVRDHAKRQEAKRQRMSGHTLWNESGITVDYQLAGHVFTAKALKARVLHGVDRVDSFGVIYTRERPLQLVIEGHGGLIVIDCLTGKGLATIGYTQRPIQLLAPLTSEQKLTDAANCGDVERIAAMDVQTLGHAIRDRYTSEQIADMLKDA